MTVPAARARAERLYPALAGVVFAIATFEGVWLAGYLLLIGMAVAKRKLPPWWGWALALPIGISTFWAASWWQPILVSVTILALSVMVPALMSRLPWVAVGFLAALVWQTFGLLLVIQEFRPAGFTGNSDMLGQVGLTTMYLAPAVTSMGAFGQVFAVLTAGATLGIAGARAVLLGATALVMVKPRKILIACYVATGLFAVGTAMLTHSLDRYTLRGVASAANNRLQVAHVGYQTLVNPSRDDYVRDITTMEKRERLGIDPKDRIPPDFHITQEEFDAVDHSYPYQKPKLSWFGYGYQSFLPKTHTGQPHVIPVYMVYELGILSAVIFGVIAWAFWTRRLPWQLAFAMIPVWGFSHEYWTSAGGVQLLALATAGAVWMKQHETAHVTETWARYFRWLRGFGRRRQPVTT